MSKEYVLSDTDFLVSQTDEKGRILFANEDFCKIAGYTLDELIGQPHNIIRHPDMPKAAFKDLWDTVQKGKIWTGYVKNRTKDGGYYWVYATVFPNIACEEGKCGFMSCRRKPSREEIAEAESLYQTMRQEA
ncbi:PAS domain S-box protein [Sulfuricurvum sp. IAE1]|jgi:aerotaxis receptor|uniref:PAS domain-containing protein n=1 Tax=Sulfuricurvum sp. IAE1 TaxID=2546102 RepID=UPI001051F03C|nr:PAS domain-containing protein [Sulfuricurvum sp. IAE1]MDX9966766.1 PAS domain-containing protein [Sulfuricurvum sp.]TDA65589.1 PAS domain S-box protein [Sulfuricurvum sp. IAE1]